MPADPGPSRCSERGSALLLVPVGVLIFVLLASMTVDRAIVLGAQRDLVATAEAAANNAAGAAVDANLVHEHGALAYDRVRIDQVIRRTIARSGLQGVSATWRLSGDELEVRLSAQAELVFTAGVPGVPATTPIHATASALLSPE